MLTATILVPTYNRSGLIGASLRSALAQSRPAKEIIVVDDGSTDSTRAVVGAFGGAVRYLSQANAGKATAMNLGVAEATGDAVLVLDDDDLLPPGALAHHLGALEENPAADFSYGRYSRFVDEAQLMRDVYPIRPDDRRLAVRLLERPFLPNPAWMVRRAALLREGGYNTKLLRSQDYDMIVRLARANEGSFVDAVVLHQRTHAAMRGPSAIAVQTIYTIDLWIDYDRQMVADLDACWSDADFRPLRAPYAGQERLALLQRGVILFVRKVYARAAEVLAQYRAMLGTNLPGREEVAILSGLLSCSHGITEITAADEQESRWLRALALPPPLRLSASHELRWRLIAALKAGNWVQAGGLLRFGTRAFGVDIWLRLLFAARKHAQFRAISDHVES